MHIIIVIRACKINFDSNVYTYMYAYCMYVYILINIHMYAQNAPKHTEICFNLPVGDT